MPYLEALQIAEAKVTLLSPYCDRIQIAGSIRRECPVIGDIEIVCIAKPYQTGLFEDGIASVVNKWEKVKGDLVYGKNKYTQRILPEGIKLDLFFAEPGNWGTILCIRTGSADYSRFELASGWVKQGYTSIGGYLWKDGKRHEVREEVDLFKIIGIPWLEPKLRI